MYKPKKVPVKLPPTYIHFWYRDPTITPLPDKEIDWIEDGSLIWDGDEWKVFKENPSKSLKHILYKEWNFGEFVYTKKDRDMYRSLYYNPTMYQKVEISNLPPIGDSETTHPSSPDVIGQEDGDRSKAEA